MRVWRLMILAFAGALVGCATLFSSGENGPTGPGTEPQVANVADAFSYQQSGLQNFTRGFSYTWRNTGTVARVSHASSAGATGTATLTVTDVVNAQVYSAQLASSGQPSTTAGVAGLWTITVVYSNYTNAQVNFTLAKQ